MNETADYGLYVINTQWGEKTYSGHSPTSPATLIDVGSKTVVFNRRQRTLIRMWEGWPWGVYTREQLLKSAEEEPNWLSGPVGYFGWASLNNNVLTLNMGPPTTWVKRMIQVLTW